MPAKRPKRAPQNLSAQKVKTSSSKAASKKKKAHLKVVDADSRLFIDHLVVDLELLRDHAVERVVELLENQGWGNLFLGTGSSTKS